MANAGNGQPSAPSCFDVHVPTNSAGMMREAALDAGGTGLGEGVTTAGGVGVRSAVAVGMEVGVSAAGVAGGLAPEEHATSSPARGRAINIPVRVLARTDNSRDASSVRENG
jgi:hypothetical protein